VKAGVFGMRGARLLTHMGPAAMVKWLTLVIRDNHRGRWKNKLNPPSRPKSPKDRTGAGEKLELSLYDQWLIE
jgi:hypothetical protein